MSKRTKIVVYSVIVLIICVLIIYPIVKKSSTPNKSEGKGKPGQTSGPTIVKGKILKFDSFASEIKVMGKIIADEWVDISPEVSGKIVKINFKEGATVSKGQLLVKINDADLQAQMKRSEVKLQLAKENLARQEKLFEVNGTSKEQYDNAIFEYRTIEADIDLLKAQINKTEIKAPFSGQIGLRLLSEGAFVLAGEKIATLQSKARLKLDFTVPQNYSVFMKEGKTLTFKLGNELEPSNAKIYAIEPGVDQQTATLKVRAYISEKNKDFIPGKIVEVQMSLSAPIQTILIPTETLVPEISGHSVFLFKNGKSVSVPVQIGDRNDKVVQILTGINPGDTLIVSGLIQLRPDSPVKLSGITE
jgi:membrane fusion protein (multidrug efflux system)